MLGRYIKKYIQLVGARNKKSFQKNLEMILSKIPSKEIDVDIVSMSGSKYFYDQLLSLFSFYYNVGTPSSFTIYNDGSYTSEQIALLSRIKNVCVKDFYIEKYCNEFKLFPTLKKIYILQQLIPKQTTFFSDSDILFFPSFSKNINLLRQYNCYLVDENNFYFDEFMPNDINIDFPLNLGFLVLNSTPNWSIVNEYIDKRIAEKKLHYWTDQTAMHILAIKEKFWALPKKEFVVGGKDAFKTKDVADYSEISLRHFVGPIRHKMWQHKWQKILNSN